MYSEASLSPHITETSCNQILRQCVQAEQGCHSVSPSQAIIQSACLRSDLLLMPSPHLTLSQIVQWLINTAELRTSNPLMLVLLWLDTVNYYNLISHNTTTHHTPHHTHLSAHCTSKSYPHKNTNVNYPRQWNLPIWLDNWWVLLMVRTVCR